MSQLECPACKLRIAALGAPSTCPRCRVRTGRRNELVPAALAAKVSSAQSGMIAPADFAVRPAGVET